MTVSDLFNIGLMQGFAGLSLFAVLLLMGLGPVSYTHLTLPTICSV